MSKAFITAFDTFSIFDFFLKSMPYCECNPYSTLGRERRMLKLLIGTRGLALALSSHRKRVIFMNALEQEVQAALKAIKNKDKAIAKDLEKAAGYAVFPSVGRASLVLGGAYGHGLLFEGNKSIGEVTVGQFTIGIQLGGQSFSLLVIFCTKDALERIKHGRIAFSANASAVIAKAAASGAADFERDVVAKAYSKGGMLLEVSLGGQGFRFRPKATLDHPIHPESKHQKKAG